MQTLTSRLLYLVYRLISHAYASTHITVNLLFFFIHLFNIFYCNFSVHVVGISMLRTVSLAAVYSALHIDDIRQHWTDLQPVYSVTCWHGRLVSTSGKLWQLPARAVLSQTRMCYCCRNTEVFFLGDCFFIGAPCIRKIDFLLVKLFAFRFDFERYSVYSEKRIRLVFGCFWRTKPVCWCSKRRAETYAGLVRFCCWWWWLSYRCLNHWRQYRMTKICKVLCKRKKKAHH